jgi:predicted secreted protein
MVRSFCSNLDGFSQKRKKKVIIIFSLLFFLFLMTGLNIGVVAIRGMTFKSALTITKEHNGQEMEVKSGDVFQIELEEMGSAGYSWQIDRLNTDYLELVSKKTRVISKSQVGAPVIAVWLFKAKKAGDTEIMMNQYRLWEGKEKTTDYFLIRLTIK